MLFKRSLPAPARPTSITTLDGSDLEYVDIYKYLGVWLDCKLSLQTHIKLKLKTFHNIPVSGSVPRTGSNPLIVTQSLFSEVNHLSLFT